MAEEDVFQLLVSAATRLARGEEVRLDELFDAVSSTIGSDLASLRNVRVFSYVLDKLVERLRSVAEIIASLQVERLSFTKRLQELLTLYVTGLIVGTRDCIVVSARQAGALTLECIDAERALALAALDAVGLLELRV